MKGVAPVIHGIADIVDRSKATGILGVTATN